MSATVFDKHRSWRVWDTDNGRPHASTEQWCNHEAQLGIISQTNHACMFHQMLCGHMGTQQHMAHSAGFACYLTEHCAEPMVNPDDMTSPNWRVLPKQEIGCKNAHQGKVLLAAESHNGQSCLYTHGQVPVVGTLHLGNL